MTRPRLVACLPWAAACLLWGPTASANSRYPSANQLVLDPVDPLHFYLRATYGLLSTRDGGAHWSWLCERAIGFTGTFDPPIAAPGGGRVLAGLVDGVRFAEDGGCSFGYVAPALFAGAQVIDLATAPSDPERVGAVTHPPRADGAQPILGLSSDGGRTFTASAGHLPLDFYPQTLDFAPSRSARIYVSGVGDFDRFGILARTDDGGATWTQSSFDLGLATAPFISAVDPGDPDTIYARFASIDGGHDSLQVSRDQGRNWTLVVGTTDAMLGFALSPDGRRFAVGSVADGLLIGDASTLVVERRNSLGVRCLKWTPEGLYACATEKVDGFSVGVSRDEGRSFRPFYRAADLDDAHCPPGTSSASVCAGLFDDLRSRLGIADGGFSDGGGDASEGFDGGSDAGGHRPSPRASGGGGCACTQGRRADVGASALPLLLVALLARRRRPGAPQTRAGS